MRYAEGTYAPVSRTLYHCIGPYFWLIFAQLPLQGCDVLSTLWKMSSSRSWMPVVRCIVHALQLHVLYINHGTLINTEERKSRGWTSYIVVCSFRSDETGNEKQLGRSRWFVLILSSFHSQTFSDANNPILYFDIIYAFMQLEIISLSSHYHALW